MNIICIQDDAFHALVDKVAERLMNKLPVQQNKWISDEEAMKMLNITSKTTLQNLRDKGKIEFTQPMKKVILYNYESINAYLDKHRKKAF